jgi:hypothetical protein
MSVLSLVTRPDEDKAAAIEVLERALEEVKKPDGLVIVGVVGVYPDGSMTHSSSPGRHLGGLLGALEILKYNLLKVSQKKVTA